MAYLDAFVLVSDQDRAFITLRERSITFSKNAIEKLNFCPYVHMYVDRKGRRVAFQVAKQDENAIPFYKEPKEGRSILVRISDKKKTKMLLDLADMAGTEKGVRFYGEYTSEERLIGFDLSMPVL